MDYSGCNFDDDATFPSIWRDKPANRRRWRLLQNSNRFLLEQLNRVGVLNCKYCGMGPLSIYSWDDPMGRNAHDKATADHVIPVSRGGPDEFHNMVISCFPCNRDKGCN